MTIAASTGRISHDCNGILLAFAFGFNISATSEVKVIVATTAGVESVLSEGTQYTVSATNSDFSSGGTVTVLDVALVPSGSKLTIKRNTALTQESDFTEGMAELYGTFEAALDKLTRQIQQLQEQVDRSFKITPSAYDDASSPDMEAEGASFADKIIKFNSAGDELELVSVASAGTTLLDEDDMASDSASSGATQQSIKAYVDSQDAATIAANILDEDDFASDSATKAPSQQSVGAYLGSNYQPLDTELTALAGLTSAANKVLRFTGSGTAGLLDFLDEDNMASNSATAVPSQQSVKAYIDGSSAAVLLDEDNFASDSDVYAPTQQSTKAYILGQAKTFTAQQSVVASVNNDAAAVATNSSITGGIGLAGQATGATGSTIGVYALASSTAGTGIYGHTSAATGATVGVYGKTDSTSGKAVYGYAAAATGTTYGGYFKNDSATTDAAAVFGIATDTSAGVRYGGYFQADSVAGRAIKAYATGTGASYAGYFESLGFSYAVYGISSTTGAVGSTGVGGVSAASDGTGVNGACSSVTGVNYGVKGASFSASGYDFYAYGAGADGPFTGAHDAVIAKDVTYDIGDIVVDKAIVVKRNISNCISEVKLSTFNAQKGIVGVLSSPANPLDPANMPAAMYEMMSEDFFDIADYCDRVIINALGEGQVNVCNEGGDIEIGDLICTSSISGKGMLQPDDLIHGYTVAKAREAVTWEQGDDSIKQIACIYLCG